MRFTVIITTYNRVYTLRKAIDSVLEQQGADFELLVVDDGSTDGTADLLIGLTDPRIVAIRRDNGGLSAARNTGISRAAGDWITFLDDDDLALPGWLSGLAGLIDDATGIVCCGADFSTSAGARNGTAEPGPMGPLFQDQTGLMLAGTFAVRADLLHSVAGYDERLTCSHQTELAMRLMPAMLEQGLRIRNTDRSLIRIERRDPNDRPMSNPAALYEGTRVLLEKHDDKIARNRHGRAVLNGVLGVSAARLGLWQQARVALLISARAEPFRTRHWLRLVAACCPPIGRRLWRIHQYQQKVLV